MGCSSGRLRAQRAYEPSGAVLAYLLAGGLHAAATSERSQSFLLLAGLCSAVTVLCCSAADALPEKLCQPLLCPQAAQRQLPICGM